MEEQQQVAVMNERVYPYGTCLDCLSVTSDYDTAGLATRLMAIVSSCRAAVEAH
jgi:hypothetical protein